MMTSRREILKLAAAAGLRSPEDLVDRVEVRVVWRGRGGTGPTWFQTRACALPGPTVLMTCQTITGSDYYGPVHWSESRDLGLNWTPPQPIPGMGRKKHPDGVEEGVCDTVPEYHPRTRTVLAMGHNVYYKDGKLTRPNTERWPVYTVRRASGDWSPPQRLEWDNPEASAIYTSGCAQRITLPDGDILVPLSYGPVDRADRAVTTVLCSFDGSELKVKKTGSELRLATRRGLLEPSLAVWGNRYFMTIRAEDDRGYVATSDDGLRWSERRPWCWDDGEPLIMSSTQQRWLAHSDSLYLVYTRKAPENAKVVRWRAPLFMARVDPRGPSLVRASERVVFPLRGDPGRNPGGVAHLGNFHTNAVTSRISFITVGETVTADAFRGDTLLARVFWRKSNRIPGIDPVQRRDLRK